MADRRQAPPVVAALAVIWIAVTGAAGLTWGLPYIWHPDEKVGNAVDMLRRHSADPQYFINPHLHIYLVTGAVWIAQQVVPGRIQLDMPAIIPLTDPAHPDRAAQFAANLSARSLSVLFAAAAVWWLWRSSRRRLGEWPAALAAAGLATSMGLMNVAHFATPEALLVALTVGALGAFDRLQVDSRPRDALASGVFLGLACATKYTGILLLVPLLVASLRVWRRHGPRRAAGQLSLLCLVAAVAFFATMPYAAIHWREFVNDGLIFSWGTGAPSNSLAAESRTWTQYLGYLANAMGLPLFALGVVGLVAAFADRRAPSASREVLGLHAAWVASVYAFLGLSSHHAMRFVMPIVPSLAVLAASALWTLWTRAPSPRARRVTRVAGVAVLVYSCAYSVQGVRSFLHDPRYEAGRWLAAHLAPGVGVSYFAIESYVPYFDHPAYPVTYREEVWRLTMQGDRFREWRARTLPTLPDVIVDSKFFYQRFLDDADRRPERARLYLDLLHGTDPAGYAEVARFTPVGPWWLHPRLELAAPEVVVFAKPGQVVR